MSLESNLEEEKQRRSHYTSEFICINKVTIMKIAWNWHKNRHLEQ